MSKLSKRDSQFRSVMEVRPFEDISQIQVDVAGADIEAHEIVVCVAGAEDTQIIRTFGNYTIDL